MTKYYYIGLLLLLSGWCFSQASRLSIRPAISRNFLNVSFGQFSGENRFDYGGTGNGTIGPSLNADWQLIRKPKNNSVMAQRMSMFFNQSIVAAIHYTDHELVMPGKTENLDLLNSKFGLKYIHVPIIFHLYNFKPFLLDENFSFGFGIGLVNSFLLKSTLEEEATVYEFDMNGSVTGQQYFYDKADVTSISKKYFTMICFEMSFSFKKLYISQRGWFSVGDQYISGLAGNWNVPEQYSVYINARNTFGGKVYYGGGAFIIGWKIN